MRLGIIGHDSVGKSLTCEALTAMVGEHVIAIDTKAAAVQEWLHPGAGVDGVILVVSVTEGPMPLTKEHLALTAEAGLQPIAVWLNKMDIFHHGPELLEIIEVEVRDLLSTFKLEDEDIPIVSGSSLKALEELESGHPGPWTGMLRDMWKQAVAYYHQRSE